MAVYEVTEQLDGCHDIHTDYPLLPGDILVEDEDGSFAKTAPGLGIFGFILSSEQKSTLKELEKHPPITFM